MYPKNILGSLLVFALALAPCAYAGKVELTTYYPSPNGEYTNLTSTADSSFATTSGNVGIGTASPAAKLDVAGEVKFGNTSSLCNATNKGQQRYNTTSNLMEFCNGTAWTAYGTQRAWVTLSPDIGSCPSGWVYYGAFTWSYNGVSYEQCYKDY